MPFWISRPVQYNLAEASLAENYAQCDFKQMQACRPDQWLMGGVLPHPVQCAMQV